MPSILSHPAIALAAYPWLDVHRRRMLLAGAACTILPDLDVLSFALGIAYEDPLGHRGLTHSILVAAVLAISVSRLAGLRSRKELAYLFLCSVSHGLLDACTNGGRGVGLLLPFSTRRFFFPWRPIEVSPIGAGFFSVRGLETLQSELRWLWLPAVLIGSAGWLFRQTRRKAPDLPD